MESPQPAKVPPPGFAHRATLNLASPWMTLGLNLLGLLLLLLWGWAFWRAGAWLRPELRLLASALHSLRVHLNLPLLIGVMLLVVILHEAAHGLFFWLFTRERPTFGVGLLYAYAAAPGWYLPRNQFIIIGLAPLVLLSAIGLIGLPWLPFPWVPPLLVGLIINAAGAAGDLYVVARLLRQPRAALVRDEGATMVLFTPVADVLPDLRRRWWALAAGFGMAEAQAKALFADLCAHYAPRPYHNLTHIHHLLQLADEYDTDMPAFHLAIWYHDVIYDPRAGDNEALSADYAQNNLAGLVPQPILDHAAALIRATTHRAIPDDPAARLLLDLDLSILATSADVYTRYQEAIRREYAGIPDNLYHLGRQQVLAAFLARPRIFLTEALAHLEPPARRNLHAELTASRPAPHEGRV